MSTKKSLIEASYTITRFDEFAELAVIVCEVLADVLETTPLPRPKKRNHAAALVRIDLWNKAQKCRGISNVNRLLNFWEGIKIECKKRLAKAAYDNIAYFMERLKDGVQTKRVELLECDLAFLGEFIEDCEDDFPNLGEVCRDAYWRELEEFDKNDWHNEA